MRLIFETCTCPRCDGSGSVAPKCCELCSGNGTFKGKPCGNCTGHGRTLGGTCWRCKGSGRTRTPAGETAAVKARVWRLRGCPQPVERYVGTYGVVRVEG